MLFSNIVFGRHKGKKYVNVFVKNIGVSRMVERLGKSEKKNMLCRAAYSSLRIELRSELYVHTAFV